MSAQLPESLLFRLHNHGDPPFWLHQLTKEQIFEYGRVQLEYEKAINAAHAQYLSGVHTLLQKSAKG